MMKRILIAAFVLASVPVQSAAVEVDALIIQLCSGSSVSISLGDNEDKSPAEPCHLKACHAAACRQKSKKPA